MESPIQARKLPCRLAISACAWHNPSAPDKPWISRGLYCSLVTKAVKGTAVGDEVGAVLGDIDGALVAVRESDKKGKSIGFGDFGCQVNMPGERYCDTHHRTVLYLRRCEGAGVGGVAMAVTTLSIFKNILRGFSGFSNFTLLVVSILSVRSIACCID